MSSSAHALLTTTPTGIIQSWSVGATELYGYTAKEAIGRSVYALTFVNKKDYYDASCRRILAGQELESITTTRKRKSGELMNVAVELIPVKNETGQVVGILCSGKEVDAKDAEDLVLPQKTGLHAFLFDSPLALIRVTPEGRLERANNAFCTLMGKQAMEIRNQPIEQMFLSPEPPLEVLRQLAEKQPVRNCRARLRRPNHSRLHVLIDAAGSWEGDTYLNSHWFIRDITERVELQRQILQAVENEQRRFGHDLHDDLCQQLTGIEFLCQTLAHDRTKCTAAGAKIARTIARLLRQANRHARDLARGLSPVETGHDGLVVALHNLAATTSTSVTYEYHFHCDRPVLVADSNISLQLFRIAQEAVNNSVRNGHAHRVDITLTESDDRLELTVQDDGPGLPRKPSKDRSLSLQIMTHRAKAIEGELTVRPRAGGGTEVICKVGTGSRHPFTLAK